MKKFITENWYKLMIGSSLMMASFGFMMHSVSPARAYAYNSQGNQDSSCCRILTNPDGSINVKLSEEQLNKIIPKNEDGSINVKLSDKPVKVLATPVGVTQVVIVDGWSQNSARGAYVTNGKLQVDYK